MPSTSFSHGGPLLLAFNDQMLAQAVSLAVSHADAGRARYAGPVGSHLRHVIEHWEALALAPNRGWVDYDARPRDPALEACPAIALARLLALRTQLGTWDEDVLDIPLQVRGLCGPSDESAFEVPSSIGRELAFVASHAVHHFAWLRLHGLQEGVTFHPDFGKAPATLAHERKGSAQRPETDETVSGLRALVQPLMATECVRGSGAGSL